MVVLSVDLAHKRWADIGVCSLEAAADAIVIEPISLPALGLSGAPTAEAVAEVVADLAGRLDARLVLLDGPQAWKDPANGLEHCRLCECELATPGKTGPPGTTKPANWLGFFAFAIEVFDLLGGRGWPRLPSPAALGSRDRFALESFPTSAWRWLGQVPLPGKSNKKGTTVAGKLAELRQLVPITLRGPDSLSHDELQAAVAGLAGIAADGASPLGCELVGVSPFELDGTWREGFIVNPTIAGVERRGGRKRSPGPRSW